MPGVDVGADADDAALVEIRERLLRAVRDVARDLLVAELRRAGVDLVFVDVDRAEHVVLDEPLRDDDRVLEVEALPRHERNEQIGAERELAAVRRRAVGDDLAALHLVAEDDRRLLVDQRALVRAHELRQRVLVARPTTLDDDALRVHVDDRAVVVCEDDVTGVDRSPELEPGADDRRLRDHQRHSLLLHVRAHERTVRVVVLEERDERRRDRHDLRRRDVHVLDVLREHRDRLALARAAQHLLVQEAAGLRIDRLGRLRDRELTLLGGIEVDDLVRHACCP